MTFILITGSIMTISIFLIYRLCRFFDIEMKWTSLVLCAVMAFIVNGMAITMSPFLDRGHYLRLGILVVTAAALVTFFNERMLRREESLAGHCTVLTTEELPLEEEPPVEDDMLTADHMEEPDQTNHEETTAAPAEPAMKQAADAEAQKAVEAAQIAAQAVADKEAKIAAEKAKKEAQAKAEAEAEKAAKERAERKKREEEAAAKARAEAEAKAKRQAHEQELKQAISRMDSLDAILDFAYEAKDAAPKDAIWAYREAITRYSDDDYTPFLIIELGNLYKEQANYSGAIATYKQALDMPIIAQNAAMCQEFTKNIHYLGTVQDILAKHAALSTPFPQIPGEIMQEIETEFQAHSDRAAK